MFDYGVLIKECQENQQLSQTLFSNICCTLVKIMTTGRVIKYDLQDRLVDFAAAIISLVGKLPENRVSFHLGNQLLRSGTSPALNYGEALAAESRRDFVHKLKIGLKELRETFVTLRILVRINFISSDIPELRECDELIAIFAKSIQTASLSLKG